MTKRRSPKSESKLAEKVIVWLQEQHWDVYQEVQFRRYSGIADIVAVRNGYLWIIETKLALTFTVMEQAWSWRAHFRSAAIPKARSTRGRWAAEKFARESLKIGILEISEEGYINENIPAPLMREFHQRSKEMIGDLREEHKTYAIAGSRNGGYFTPYRSTMIEVEMFIRNHPGCTLKQIMDSLSRHHYSSKYSARTGIRAGLANWESSWCEVQMIDGKGHYFHKKASYER